MEDAENIPPNLNTSLNTSKTVLLNNRANSVKDQSNKSLDNEKLSEDNQQNIENQTPNSNRKKNLSLSDDENEEMCDKPDNTTPLNSNSIRSNYTTPFNFDVTTSKSCNQTPILINDVTPIQMDDNTPIQNDDIHRQNDNTPIQYDNTPVQNDNTPMKNDNTPMKNDNTPVQNDSAPEQSHVATPQYDTSMEVDEENQSMASVANSIPRRITRSSKKGL